MKKIFYLKYLIVCTLFLFYSVSGIAQCPGGYTRDTLNWDNLDFLPNTCTYTSPTAWIILAQSQTQKFTLGTQTVTVTHNYSTTKQSAKIKIDETELKINIKSLSSQLYFLKIINSNNESIYFNKFLKQ